jgi:hypothetical protein
MFFGSGITFNKPLSTVVKKVEYKKYAPSDMQIVESAHKTCINSGAAIQQWANKNINLDIIEQWKLGWIDEFRWRDDDGKDRVNPAGVIPFFDENDKLSNIQVRLFGDTSGARYRAYKSGYGTSAFGLSLLEQNVIIVEGAIKAMLLNSAGFLTVAIPSIRNFSACGMKSALEKANVKRFYVWLDPQTHGKDGNIIHHSTIGWLKESAKQNEIFMIQSAMKPDDMLIRHGAKLVESTIRQARMLRP